MSRHKIAHFAVEDDKVFWAWLDPDFAQNTYYVELVPDFDPDIADPVGVLIEDVTVERNDPVGRWVAFPKGAIVTDARRFVQQGRAIDYLIDGSGWREDQTA
ncbi:hypothetical protein [Aeromicrobium sp. 179-A 4D2 NHS]|uniref:hypothetical protein n=1 Tax=Aeromicrobium sp. 179-A 4D2 NHS TaxID=3142375 RepID=UPI0039A333DC